jgi:hypothetical protein
MARITRAFQVTSFVCKNAAGQANAITREEILSGLSANMNNFAAKRKAYDAAITEVLNTDSYIKQDENQKIYSTYGGRA